MDILKIYFSASGRLRRLPYFLYGLALGFVYFILNLGLSFLDQGGADDGMALVMLVFLLPLTFVMLYASIILAMKRLHDLDKSGWWQLLFLVPIVNLGLAIYLLFFKGTAGPNRFGNPQP